jgi:hypothetical protein
MKLWSVIKLIKEKNNKNVILYFSGLQPSSLPVFNANATESHFKVKKPYEHRSKPFVIKPEVAFKCGLLKNSKSGK